MTSVEEGILAVLNRYISYIMARSVLALSLSWSGVNLRGLAPGDGSRLLVELEKGIRLYVHDKAAFEKCIEALGEILGKEKKTPVSIEEIDIPISEERDIVTARGVGREVCRDLGFSESQQTKVATAISELARNIVQYAGTGEIRISTGNGESNWIEVVARDNGPGIAGLTDILEGRYRSRSGMGVGLRGTRKMMDEFEVETGPLDGTVVRIRKGIE